MAQRVFDLEDGNCEALRIPVGTNLAETERRMIIATLDKCGGNKTRAAALLGVSLKTLYNRLNAYRRQAPQAAHPDDTKSGGERETGNDTVIRDMAMSRAGTADTVGREARGSPAGNQVGDLEVSR